MSVVYSFKVAAKFRRGLWRIIEIRGNQTLGELDGEIRRSFKYDEGDHLSEFFSGSVWKSEGHGEIYPGGRGPGGSLRIDSLGLVEGQRIAYVYDFGDDVQSVITLERIEERKEGRANGNQIRVSYPRVVAQNRPRHKYCVTCKRAGKTAVATDVCADCSNEELEPSYLCQDCAGNHGEEEEEHHIEELVY